MEQCRQMGTAGSPEWISTIAAGQNGQTGAGPRTSLLVSFFCVCAFVVLCRPQDIVQSIGFLRPALLLEVATLAFLCISHSKPVPAVSLDNRQVKLFLSLIVFIAASVPLAYHRGLAFSSTMDYLKLALFFYLFTMIADSAASVKAVLKIACLGVLMYISYVLAAGIQDRLTPSGMFDANDLPFFIISFLPFNFLFLAKGNPLYMRLASILNLGFGCLTILMTGSRGGFISLLFVLAMLLLQKTQTVRLMYKAAFVVLCLALVFLKSASIDFDRLGTAFSPGNDYNVTEEWGRKDIWERGLALMITHPLTGVGAGCFDMAIGEGRLEEGRAPKWQTAHNSFIQIGAETGVIGLVLFSLLTISAYGVFRAAAKKGVPGELSRIGEMACIGFVGQFIAGLFLSQAYSPYWVFYIALSVSLASLLGEKDGPLCSPRKEPSLARQRTPLRRVIR